MSIRLLILWFKYTYLSLHIETNERKSLKKKHLISDPTAISCFKPSQNTEFVQTLVISFMLHTIFMREFVLICKKNGVKGPTIEFKLVISVQIQEY